MKTDRCLLCGISFDGFKKYHYHHLSYYGPVCVECWAKLINLKPASLEWQVAIEVLKKKGKVDW